MLHTLLYVHRDTHKKGKDHRKRAIVLYLVKLSLCRQTFLYFVWNRLRANPSSILYVFLCYLTRSITQFENFTQFFRSYHTHTHTADDYILDKMAKRGLQLHRNEYAAGCPSFQSHPKLPWTGWHCTGFK